MRLLRWGVPMRLTLYALSFSIAFLLFAVQPLAGKLVLPVLGGTPAVWNTTMLTFQVLLLLGYLYAHLITTYLALRQQLVLHGGLIGCSFLFLPMMVAITADDTVMLRPIVSTMTALISQIGLPFFLLATTAPLIQSWVSQSRTSLAKTPYVLYSASNLGSLLALMGYVVAVEPLLDLTQQRMTWSIAYALSMGLLLVTGWLLTKDSLPVRRESIHALPTTWPERLVWVGLAFIVSSLSLGLTSYIAIDVASIPLLWVVPLAIYLLSFVDAFRSRPVLVKPCMRIAGLIGLIAACCYWTVSSRETYGFIIHLGAFFVLAFALHGHLASRKPDLGKLTTYYLCLSIGGALGGVLNAVIAPIFFTDAIEYPLVLLIASLVAYILRQKHDDVVWNYRMMAIVAIKTILFTLLLKLFLTVLHAQTSIGGEGAPNVTVIAIATSGLMALVLYRRFEFAIAICFAVLGMVMVMATSGVHGYETVYKARNFFGVEKVFERKEPSTRIMMHNTTVHGLQSLNLKESLRPVSYYAALREIFDSLPQTKEDIAAIGLGVGSIQCYAKKDQHFDYFEINPEVIKLATDRAYFRYLSDCPGEYRTILGDGRIKIAQESDARYGALVLDAFSSDSIPVHLLTHEAFDIYRMKLNPNGIIMIHTTNRHIDLWPLLALQAQKMGWVAYGKNFKPPADDPLIYETYWAILAPSEADIAQLRDQHSGWVALTPDAGARPWSDQYTNILPYLKMLR